MTSAAGDPVEETPPAEPTVWASGPSAVPALVLVATPIGNLGDLSTRQLETLRTADVVACEDTRRTGRLLQLAGIRAKALLRIDAHTEAARAQDVIDRIHRGQRVAVVTDAGMPGISDPGERLVRAAVDAGVRVEVVPGPSAALTALVGSGLPAGRFCFEGFLPRKGSGRSQRLAAIASDDRTTVVYESPHRVARTLADLAEVCGADRRVVVARELTKLHEEFWRGSLGDAVVWAEATPPRGEVALVVDGAPAAPPAEPDDVEAAVRAALDAGASVKDAAASVAAALGLPKRAVYAVAVRLGRTGG